MNLDLGTLSGVLGVVLTIVFFFIGYRQTIGAKRERAAAANREIIETMVRRFTLDSEFGLRFDEVERFVAGVALDNRVRVSDVYSMDEIFSLLYSRIVSSDYVPAKKRRAVLEKLSSSFVAPSMEARLVRRAVEKTRKLPIETALGAASAILGAGLATATEFVASGWLDRLSVPSTKLSLLVAIAVSALTAIALVAYVKLRDKVTATKPDLISPTKGQAFEAGLIERLRAIGVPFAQERDVDLIISVKQKRVAVELKLAPPHNVRSILKQLEHYISQYKCDEAYLVLATPVPEKIRALSGAHIKIMSVDEFLNILTSPEPIRGTAV
jgi:hypothetical protein